MRFLLITIFFLFIVFDGFSQIETPKKKINIAPIFDKNAPIQNTSENKVPTVIKFESSIGKNKDQDFYKGLSNVPKVQKENKPVEAPRNAGELYTDRVKSTLNSEKNIVIGFKSDSFLGSFKSGTKIIKIACRDHEYPDGDVVRVWLNDRVEIQSILLTEDFKEVFLNLEEGINKIEVEALNQGESGPNTAQFVITDNNGVVITNNRWNLLTGAKAKLVVTKVDQILK
jgi:hypothetical protein